MGYTHCGSLLVGPAMANATNLVNFTDSLNLMRFCYSHALQEQREWLASQGGTGSNGDDLYAALDASTISVSACSSQQTAYVCACTCQM